MQKSTSLKVQAQVLESDDTAAGILFEIEKEKASLAVLGARGLTPLKAFFLGSVSQKVSRHTQASVLIVRRAPPAQELKVLLPLDGSPASERAVDFLEPLGLPETSHLTLIHVLDHPMAMQLAQSDFYQGYGPPIAYQPVPLETYRENGERLLDEWKKKFSKRFKSVRSRLVEGHIAGEVIRAAEEEEADLIVMGKRGLTGLDRFLLGSVSQKVSSYAPCSVLIVH